MPIKELPLAGPSYQSRSKLLANQRTKNLYPEVNKETPKQLVLMPTPGPNTFAILPTTVVGTTTTTTTNTGRGRGLWNFNDTLYKVTGQRLYRISKNGDQTEIGHILGHKRCCFRNNASELVIVSAGRVYRYDGTTLTLATDIDLENPNYVAYLNNQAIYDGLEGRFAVSDAGNLTSVDPLNYSNAEAYGDVLVRPIEFNQRLVLLGAASIEQQWNSGTGNPPFDRVEGSAFPVGILAGDSAAFNLNALYWLGNDRRVYGMSGGKPDAVSDIPLNNWLQSIPLNQCVDAIGFCYTFQSQNFYQLRVGDRTYVLHEPTMGWFEMTTGVNEGQHFATAYAYCYGKHLVEDGGYVHEWTTDHFTDSNATHARVTVRERSTATIDSKLLGLQPGLTLFMGRLTLLLEPGVGNADGAGVDPVIVLSFSDDGGDSWSSQYAAEIGRMGERLFSATWDCLGSFERRILRFRLADPVFCSWHSLTADLDVGG